MGKLGKALIEHDILWLTIAVYSGGVLTDFFQAFIGDLIYPIIAAVAGSDVKSLSEKTINIGESQIKYGDFLKKLFTLIFNVALIYIFVVIIAKL
jgi:large-conductance mechanosensitive channel